MPTASPLQSSSHAPPSRPPGIANLPIGRPRTLRRPVRSTAFRRVFSNTSRGRPRTPRRAPHVSRFAFSFSRFPFSLQNSAFNLLHPSPTSTTTTPFSYDPSLSITSPAQTHIYDAPGQHPPTTIPLANYDYDALASHVTHPAPNPFHFISGGQINDDPPPQIPVLVAANPINGVDPTGLWKIERKGGPLAEAVPDEGDTIRSLADKIHMDVNEWQQWLTVEEQGISHLAEYSHFTVDSPVKYFGCSDKLSVPNTILALWLGALGAIGKADVGWGNDLQYLRGLGFNVVEKGATGFSPSALYNYFNQTSSAGQLWGFFYTGHGGPDSISDNVSFLAYYDEMKANLSYGLGFELINACEGGWSSTDIDVPEWYSEQQTVVGPIQKDPTRDKTRTVTVRVYGPVQGNTISAGGDDVHAPNAYYWGMKGEMIPQIGPFSMNTHHPQDLLSQ